MADEEASTLKKKQYRNKQCFLKKWLTIPEFKGWLSPVAQEPHAAYCKFCKKILVADRHCLLLHTASRKHQKNATVHEISSDSAGNQVDDDLSGCNKGTQTDKGHTEKKQPILSLQCASDDDDDDNDGIGISDQAETEDRKVIEKVIDVVWPLPRRGLLSCSVTDTSRGLPAAGLSVSLYILQEGKWILSCEGVTDSLGQYSEFMHQKDAHVGRYKLHFDVDRYFALRRHGCLYPFVEVVFDIQDVEQHYNICLQISPFGYVTFRGS